MISTPAGFPLNCSTRATGEPPAAGDMVTIAAANAKATFRILVMAFVQLT
jgi:hypothetical protein